MYLCRVHQTSGPPHSRQFRQRGSPAKRCSPEFFIEALEKAAAIAVEPVSPNYRINRAEFFRSARRIRRGYAVFYPLTFHVSAKYKSVGVQRK